MLAEWNAECGEDAPAIVVPWRDDASGLHYVDLRAEPYDIAEITEADRSPALSRALRSLNALRSPLLTSKCDVWTMDAEELAVTAVELDLDDAAANAGWAGYIDLLWRERAVFASSHRSRDRLDRVVRRAQRFEHPQARLDLTLRPAIFTPTATTKDVAAIEGFGTTLHLFAVGPDAPSALHEWEQALEDIVHLLRSREFEAAATSATIDTV